MDRALWMDQIVVNLVDSWYHNWRHLYKNAMLMVLLFLGMRIAAWVQQHARA